MYLYVPPKRAPMETNAHFQNLSIPFRVPSKGTLPPDSPHRASTVREPSFPEPSFIYLSKALVIELCSRFSMKLLVHSLVVECGQYICDTFVLVILLYCKYIYTGMLYLCTCRWEGLGPGGTYTEAKVGRE